MKKIFEYIKWSGWIFFAIALIYIIMNRQPEINPNTVNTGFIPVSVTPDTNIVEIVAEEEPKPEPVDSGAIVNNLVPIDNNTTKEQPDNKVETLVKKQTKIYTGVATNIKLSFEGVKDVATINLSSKSTAPILKMNVDKFSLNWAKLDSIYTNGRIKPVIPINKKLDFMLKGSAITFDIIGTLHLYNNRHNLKLTDAVISLGILASNYIIFK